MIKYTECNEGVRWCAFMGWILLIMISLVLWFLGWIVWIWILNNWWKAEEKATKELRKK